MFKLLMFAASTNIPPHFCPDFLANAMQELFKHKLSATPTEVRDSPYLLMDNTVTTTSQMSQHLVDIAVPHNDKMYVFSFYPHMYEDIIKRLKNAQVHSQLQIEAVIFPRFAMILPEGTCESIVELINENIDKVHEAAIFANAALKEEIRAGTLVMPNMRITPEG